MSKYKIKPDAMAACLWAMEDDTHLGHIECVSNHGDVYCYHAILWFKVVWEQGNNRHARYIDVLRGNATIEDMRQEIFAGLEYLNRLIRAHKQRRRPV